MRAAIRLSIPAPLPISTTFSPGLISQRLKGFPVPAKDSIEVSGILCNQVSSYPNIPAARRPVWKWKPFSGLRCDFLIFFLNGVAKFFPIQ
jgi:hypothetical protein